MFKQLKPLPSYVGFCLIVLPLSTSRRSKMKRAATGVSDHRSERRVAAWMFESFLNAPLGSLRCLQAAGGLPFTTKSAPTLDTMPRRPTAGASMVPALTGVRAMRTLWRQVVSVAYLLGHAKDQRGQFRR